MSNDNSSDESQEEKDNSSDHKSQKDIASDESKEDISSDHESKEGEKERKGVIKKEGKKINMSKEEETLQLVLKKIKKEDRETSPPRIEILVWIPDYRNIVLSHYGRCIYKQLTESDVNAGKNRLMLGKQEVKDNFLSRLQEYEIPGVDGIDVLVYGPNGQPQEMKFKIWIKNTPVFTNRWIEFVETYGLRKYTDVLRIWMFKAWKDAKICFVIDSIRFDDITKPLSKRILKSAFQD